MVTFLFVTSVGRQTCSEIILVKNARVLVIWLNPNIWRLGVWNEILKYTREYYSLRFPRRVFLGTPSAIARKQAIKKRMRSTSEIDDAIAEEIDHLVDRQHRVIDCSRWEVGQKIEGWNIYTSEVPFLWPVLRHDASLNFTIDIHSGYTEAS